MCFWTRVSGLIVVLRCGQYHTPLKSILFRAVSEKAHVSGSREEEGLERRRQGLRPGYSGSASLWGWPEPRSPAGAVGTGSASVSWFAGAAPGKQRAGLRLLCFLAPHLWFCLAEPLSYFFPHLLRPLVCPPRGCLREPLQCQVPCPVRRWVGPPP